MSPGVGQLWGGMSDSVRVKIVGGGRCLADICHTFDSKLLFNLVAAGQSGRPHRHIGVSTPSFHTWRRLRTYILKIVCIVGIEVGRHGLRACH